MQNKKQLANMTDQAEGDLATGIGRALSNVAEKVINRGENLFSIFAKGTVDVAYTTTNTISGIGHSIAKIFEWTGGSSNLVLFLNNGAIIIYLIIKHRLDRRTETRRVSRQGKPEILVMTQDSKPPVPKRKPTNCSK